MVPNSSVLIVILVFAVLFTALYTSGLYASRHQDNIIPTEPKISQLQVIEIVEQDLREEIPNLESARLYYYLYNFSKARYEFDEEYAGYVNKVARQGWPFSAIKQNPDLLQLPLIFVHANGTTYSVNSTNHSYEKLCEQPSLSCASGKLGSFPVTHDRLVYRTESIWSPAADDYSTTEGYHVVDAESGELVWNSIDSARNIRSTLPDIDYEGQRTVKMRLEEKLNPPEIIQIQIVNGSSLPEQQNNFQPEYARGIIAVDKIIWMNSDLVPHTVRSDSGYTSLYTGPFASEMIMPNGIYAYTFTDAGKYGYHCDIHPWMRGDIEMLESFA